MVSWMRNWAKSRSFRILMSIVLLGLIGGFGLVATLKNLFVKKEITGVASVNGEEISVNEFQNAYGMAYQYMQQLRKILGAQADKLLPKDLKDEILENLINQKIMQSATSNLGFDVSDDYVETKIRDQNYATNILPDLIPAQLYQKGVLNKALLDMFLEQRGISQSDFYNQVKQSIKQHLLTNLMLGAVYVPKSEQIDYFVKNYSKKKFRINTLKLDDFISKVKSEKLSEQEISDYYIKNKDDYRIPEKRSGKVWTFAPENYGIEISDQEIENFYKKNRNNYLVKPAEREIKRIIVKIDDKIDFIQAQKLIGEIETELKNNLGRFDELAKKYSGSDASKTLTRNDQDQAEVQAAFGIENINDISPITKTDLGFEIVKLVNKKDAQYKQLESVKSELRKNLLLDKFRKNFATDAQRVLSQAHDTPAIFERFISNKKTDAHVLNNVVDNQKDLSNVKLFELENIDDTNFYFDKDRGHIVKVTDLTKSSLPSLEKIKKEVVEDIYKARASEAMLKELESIKSKKTKNGELTSWIDPQNQEAFKQLADKGIAIDQVGDLSQVGSKKVILAKNNGYLIELAEVDQFNDEQFEKNRTNIEYQQFVNNFRVISSDVMNYLKKNAKIEKNEQLLRYQGSR